MFNLSNMTAREAGQKVVFTKRSQPVRDGLNKLMLLESSSDYGKLPLRATEGKEDPIDTHLCLVLIIKVMRVIYPIYGRR